MAAETQYTANTGMVKTSGANTSLTGTGSNVYDVITGASNGTLIKTVSIKATNKGASSTSQGMVRLFVYDGANTRLLMEVEIPPQGQGDTAPTFETTIELNYKLKLNYKLRVTSQTGDPFDIIAEGLNFAYYATSVRPESTNYTANTGVGYMNALNVGLDGSGTVGTNIFNVVTASAPGSGWNGLCIDSITIKAVGTVTQGMVRIFIQNGSTGSSNTFLFKEIEIPDNIPSGTSKSFSHKLVFPDKFQLQPDFKILATTQNAENFAIIADAMDWKYPA